MAPATDKPWTGGLKTKATSAQYLARVDGNAMKLETNAMKRKQPEGTVDVEVKEKKSKKMKQAAAEAAASYLNDKLTCPIEVGREREQCNLVSEGILGASEIRLQMFMVVVEVSTQADRTQQQCPM